MPLDIKAVGNKIALAVSGGIDSSAMLHYIVRHFKDIQITVFTIDHGLRKESADEVMTVKKICETYHIPSFILRLTGSAPLSGHQNFARQKRYDLLAQKAKTLNIPIIYLAHHLDDLQETLFSRLMHDSGLMGLCPMPSYFYHRGVIFHRPMLHIRRRAIEGYIHTHNIDVIHDPSNQHAKYERTHIREYLQKNDLFTDLNKLYQKALYLRRHITERRDQFIEKYMSLSALGFCQINKAVFMQLDDLLQKQILKYAIIFTTGRAYVHIRDIPIKNATIGGAYIHITHKDIYVFRENRHISLVPAIQDKPVLWDHRFYIMPHQSGNIDNNIDIQKTNLKGKSFLKQTLPFLGKTPPEDLKFIYRPESLEVFNPDPILHHLAISQPQWS